jgi:hypothetical protein
MAAGIPDFAHVTRFLGIGNGAVGDVPEVCAAIKLALDPRASLSDRYGIE